jgi:integrase
VWRAADAAGGPAGASIKLLILTGCRRDEIAHLSWDEVKVDAIQLSGDRTKMVISHRVHLTKTMREVIAGRPYIGKYVLNGDARPYSAHGQCKAKLVGLDIPEWTLHDLRRTFATGLAGLGVPLPVIERLLNHKLTGVMAIYQKHTFKAEMAEALERWSAHVASLVG